MKTITINGLQYKKNSSGIGVMIRDLFIPIAHIAKRPCKIVLPHDAPLVDDDNIKKIYIPFEHKKNIKRILFQAFKMGKKYCKDTILLTTDSKTPFFLPRSCTLFPVITDLAVFRMPEVYQKSRVLLWRIQYKYLCRKAKHFVAISEFTKKEMVDILGLKPEQIDVVYCAASEQYKPVKNIEQIQQFREKYQLPEKYLLFVGNQNPRKNLARLLLAYDKVVEQGGDSHHLVIAGEQGWKFSREDCIASIKNKDKVHFIGFVPDEDMPALYTEASLFLFTTLYEGFGIPILEAQLCGTPVLTSNCTSLPEVGGEGAIYVDPYKIENITQGIEYALAQPDMLQKLVQNGFENAKRFSWAKSVQKLNEIIERISEE